MPVPQPKSRVIAVTGVACTKHSRKPAVESRNCRERAPLPGGEGGSSATSIHSQAPTAVGSNEFFHATLAFLGGHNVHARKLFLDLLAFTMWATVPLFFKSGNG